LRAIKRFALVAGILLVFNMLALPLWWGGVSVSGGVRGLMQLTMLAGLIFILLFDLLSTGWVLTQVCWVSEQRREEGCQKGWLLVLAVLALAGMMGAKVMVDEIARETPLGGAAGEWVVLYVCLSLQLSYIVATLVQRAGSQEEKGV
jgi:hypothetical protein